MTKAVPLAPGRGAAGAQAEVGSGHHDPVSAGRLPGGIGEVRPYDPAWCLVVGDEGSDLDAARAGAAESLLCLADGVIGTRGVLEEDTAGEPCVLAAGLYEPAPAVGETLMALPRWCFLPLGEGLTTGRRVLDLRDGLLLRQATRGSARLWSARFACARRPGVAVMAAQIGPGTGAGSPAEESSEAMAAPVVSRSTLGGGALSLVTTTIRDDKSGTGSARGATIERIGVYAASARRLPSRQVAQRRLTEARGLGTAGLLAEQRAAWAARWEAADVEVVGDPEMTVATRLALFHLQSSARKGGEAAVGARGLTGPAYAGHVFWDTDVFVVPVLAAVEPASARAVLEYRLRRLPAARTRAAAEGRDGARFPWESARDGNEVSPDSRVDHHGEVVAIRTGTLEEHVTADVAWAAWNYACWTGRWSFLEGPGRPLLLDTARYWASRLSYDQAGRAHISSVIGPDEYHEDVDDNAFTNLMARWNLHRAAELVERAGASEAVDAEAESWRRAADCLIDGYDPASGLYEQFAGYHRLEPLLAKDLGTVPVAADLVLGAERLAGSQIIKQADVLMAYHLVPDQLEAGSLEANLEHYLARTAHGSSLSPSVHAAVLARAGRTEDALAMLRLAAAIDLEDLTGTTAGGLHLANLGGMWQAVVAGFAGVRITSPADPALVVDPVLPESWAELRLRLRWHGRRVRLACRHDAVFVACDQPLRVVVHGTPARVEPPGSWIS